MKELAKLFLEISLASLEPTWSPAPKVLSQEPIIL